TVAFTARVSAAAPDSGAPTGSAGATFQFFMDGAASGPKVGIDGNGEGTFNVSNLQGGAHTLSFTFSGDANFSASNSGPRTQQVNPSDTSTTVVSSLNPSVYGQAVTVTSTTGSVIAGHNVQGGRVRFQLDGVNLSPIQSV